MLVCLCTAILPPALHAAEAGALLRAVAARYTSATDYTLRVHTKSGSTSFDITLAARRPRQFRAHQKSRTSDPFELLLIADAATVWGYQPRRRLYTRFGPEPGEERSELERLHHQYFGRFQSLDRRTTGASLAGQGSVRSGGQTIRCIRVRIEPTLGDGPEELWIDPNRHLVLKSVQRQKRPVPETGDIRTTTTWSECDLDAPVDPALFSFVPPSGARRTNALEIR